MNIYSLITAKCSSKFEKIKFYVFRYFLKDTNDRKQRTYFFKARNAMFSRRFPVDTKIHLKSAVAYALSHCSNFPRQKGSFQCKASTVSVQMNAKIKVTRGTIYFLAVRHGAPLSLLSFPFNDSHQIRR